jgi:hypothetical protein
LGRTNADRGRHRSFTDTAATGADDHAIFEENLI